MNILVVDDLDFMRALIREILEWGGHHVVAEAANGRQAILLRRAWKPDITLMDIAMPRMDGLEALRHIREEDETARVIMCSSIGDDKSILQAISYGADDFIVKPFRKERLLSAIEKIHSNSEIIP